MYVSASLTVPSGGNPPSLTKTVSSGRPALIVTWTAIAGEHPNIRYQVLYRISGSTSWNTTDVTSTSTTLENLSAGTSYQVQVRAVSDLGVGTGSEIRTITTYGGETSVIVSVLYSECVLLDNLRINSKYTNTHSLQQSCHASMFIEWNIMTDLRTVGTRYCIHPLRINRYI